LEAKIGIVGGSGLYSMPGFTGQREVRLETPFGDPSDAYIVGELEGKPVAFLTRHGRGHRISPSELNFRANIYGFKQLGVEWIISLSAVGSLKEEHKPLDFVIPDQFVDRTMGRKSTFFGEGLVAHISFGDPICGKLAQLLKEACTEAGVAAKLGGTYICMEGPALSTKAESNLYRSWGMDVHRHDQSPGSQTRPRSEILLLPPSPWSPTMTAGTPTTTPSPSPTSSATSPTTPKTHRRVGPRRRQDALHGRAHLPLFERPRIRPVTDRSTIPPETRKNTWSSSLAKSSASD
jgi:purine nucleoside phosphorylase